MAVNGTPVTLPWVSEAKAVLQAWYGGNETGHGIADVVFGAVNAAGKLPLTYPRRVEDHPAHLIYRSEAGRALYGEDVYVGYRYFDRAGIEPLFPFGHGLSYTTSALADLSINQAEGSNDVQISVKVTNTGTVAGSWCSRPGDYAIRVGQSSRDANAVEGTLAIKEATYCKEWE
ncbi:hypothetical protein SCUCBS95973_007968 [Sporothrix curviconia]|uniref:beta-glucosidase n=1 Tax=Sporothrix curviconia TaxID=1260050 RepID=A0ABP0CI23_9PEZI